MPLTCLFYTLWSELWLNGKSMSARPCGVLKPSWLREPHGGFSFALVFYIHKRYTKPMKRRRRSGRHKQAPRPKTFSYMLMSLQVILMIAVLYYPGRRDGGMHILFANLMRIGGVWIVLASLWQLRRYSLSALPEPVKNARLTTAGWYKRMRHPVYSGILLWGLGTLLIRPGAVRTILYVCLVALLWFKSVREERMLEALFGSRYARYKLNTPRFIPRRRTA